MDFKLRHCVIHELIKESGKQKVETTIKSVLPNDEEYVCQLVQSLTELIGKKDNQASRGTFNYQDVAFKVPLHLRRIMMGLLHRKIFTSFPWSA
ncbi:hypothetical protein [Salmonella enterica]|uniref:hypothetical protein n=1 Tax=Salmonella enterica TaxID=28901 RepID=UPI000ACF0D40|nr:hypothetical protein [Salmonella enterica]MDJ8541510.1 hypothetical protein [Salmonella enterica]